MIAFRINKIKIIPALKIYGFIFMKKMLDFCFLFSIFCLLTSSTFSQVEKKYIRDGNKNYANGKYEDAEKNYQIALEKNAASVHGKFNRADALYRQQRFEEAAQQFGSIASNTNDKNLKAQAYHNLGNSMLQSQKFKESVDAYKNALRINPGDEDTRKNLAYAMQMLQQQQQQQQQQQNDKNENKDDKQKQDQQQQQNDKKEEKKEDQQQKEQQQQQQQEQQKNQLSKQDAQRLLESMNNDEKKLQEKLKKEKLQKVQPVEIEKDW